MDLFIPLPYLVILFAPLAAFVLLIFFGRRMPRQGDWLGAFCVGFPMAIAIAMFFQMLGLAGAAPGGAGELVSGFGLRTPLEFVVDWISVPGMPPMRLGFLIDNVTIIMLVVVTVVSFLVHVFSIGYMHGDPRYSRYFAYLGLFTFSMLGLVLSNSLLLIYMFWELVGLSSYLLIGFWFEKPSAANANKKAFLVNRVGDLGMWLGILMLFWATGSFDFREVFHQVADGSASRMTVHFLGISVNYLTLAGILVFCGAIGKSAQFPLHVWLPDAMEGPTPVSALIHAATMVAAGVYLVTRVYVIFTPAALLAIAVIGGFTALFAATIALVQNDIKKVLAYSTVSQLGYMVMGLGAGGYVAGFYHLWTHAFFKALLFLCSGSVIHAVHSQDMRDMGGLAKKLPVTFLTMTLATVAITGIGIPPTIGIGGFFSKDAILAATILFGMEHGGIVGVLLPVFGFGAAACTAFYMWRLIFMTFSGKPRDHHKHDHAHESGPAMAIPLVTLAVLTLLATGDNLAGGKWFENYVQKPHLGSYATVAEKEPEESKQHQENEHTAHHAALFLSLLIAWGGTITAGVFYYEPWKRFDAARIAARFPTAYQWLSNKYYIDEAYQYGIVRPLLALNDLLAKEIDTGIIDGLVNGTARLGVAMADYAGWFDNTYVDGAVNGTADTVLASGRAMRLVQAGKVKTYIAWFVVSIILLTVGFGVIFGLRDARPEWFKGLIR